MLYTDEDLFEAARTLRAELPQLLEPSAAQAFDDRLAQLLARVPADLRDLHYDLISNLAAEIEDHLKTNPTTQAWLEAFLAGSNQGDRKGYEPLAGNIGDPIATEKYMCPKCDYRWSRRSAGQTIPYCPNHPDTRLVSRQPFRGQP